MADYFQLSNFEVQDARDNDILILASGPRNYYHILRDAFRDKRFSRVFDDYKQRFTWGCYIYNVNSETRQHIESLLKLFQASVCIDDALNQTFALDFHIGASFDGFERTEIGNLVYNAKPYNRKPAQKHRDNASKLTEYFAEFIIHHPSYIRSDYLIAVPCHPNKSFDLPSVVVTNLCSKLSIANGQDYVKKVKHPVKSMKDLETIKEKTNNIQGAFQVMDNSPFQGKIVTVIDDIYQSGITLHEIADTLQRAGAEVQGLVATKTLSNPK